MSEILVLEDKISAKKIRAGISELAKKILDYPQVEIPIKHTFGGGIYKREITVPADTYIVGKIHKYECINELVKGDISLLTEDGPVRLQAPFTMVCKPGIQKAAYAHTEVVWATYHVVGDERDVDKIVDSITVKSYQELEEVKQCLFS